MISKNVVSSGLAAGVFASLLIGGFALHSSASGSHNVSDSAPRVAKVRGSSPRETSKLVFSGIKSGWFVTLEVNGAKRWTQKTYQRLALLDRPGKSVLMETPDGRSVHSVGFDGLERWSFQLPEMRTPAKYFGGGQVLLVTSGKTGMMDGGAKADEVFSEHEMMPIVCLDVKTGETLWVSNQRNLGSILLSNGEVMYSMRYVTVPGKGKQLVSLNKAPVDVYLEKREVRTRKLLLSFVLASEGSSIWLNTCSYSGAARVKFSFGMKGPATKTASEFTGSFDYDWALGAKSKGITPFQEYGFLGGRVLKTE